MENEATSNEIIKSVQDYIQENYKFIMEPDNVGLLAPAKEGGYAWTSANYAQEILPE